MAATELSHSPGRSVGLMRTRVRTDLLASGDSGTVASGEAGDSRAAVASLFCISGGDFDGVSARENGTSSVSPRSNDAHRDRLASGSIKLPKEGSRDQRRTCVPRASTLPASQKYCSVPLGSALPEGLPPI